MVRKSVHFVVTMSNNIHSASVRFSKNVHIIKESPCVVEFQAFIGDDKKYIVKELVFIDINNGVDYIFLFKPPFDFKTLSKRAKITNRWLTNNYHHIKWEEGFSDYDTLDNIMYHFCSKFKTFYTTGVEKRNWIQLFTSGNVYNTVIDKAFKLHRDIGCISVQNHAHMYVNCALKKAKRLVGFLQDPLDCCSGGDIGGYIYTTTPLTMHQYYSDFTEETSTSASDGISTVPSIVG